ncbi:MAG: winged helix-turn-helix domain-containing protein [Bacteroidota bacterium]
MRIWPFFGLLTLLLLGLSISGLGRPTPGPTILAPAKMERKANLLLRELGDALLRTQGDSSSYLPPVHEREAGDFVLYLNRYVEYDSLLAISPSILSGHEELEQAFIALEDCTTEEALLGFVWTSAGVDVNAACLGRERRADCYQLSLSYPLPVSQSRSWWSRNYWWLLLWAMTALGLLWYQARHKPSIATKGGVAPGVSAASTPPVAVIRNRPAEVQITAQSCFLPSQQLMRIGAQEVPLTYREAKLLEYLLDHQNEPLSREQIKAAVWGSEGLVVGRSLDVFISRLRKLLVTDEDVKIKTLHGLGYRLEV